MNKISSLTNLVSIGTLEKIQDNFSDAVGIGCVIRNLKGKTITRFSKPSRLWLEVIKHPEIEKEANDKLITHLEKSLKTGQIEIVERYLDTYAFIAPLSITGQIVAFLIGGLTRMGNPNIERCAEESQRLSIDLDRFLEMYLELTFVTKKRLEASANLFKIIASSISNLAKEGSEAKAKVNKMTSLKNLLVKEVEVASVELKESEERYKKLFNTINDGVYIANLNGNLKDINPAGARMFGYTRAEVLGIQLKTLYVNPPDRDIFMSQLLKADHIENFLAHIRLKNGHTNFFETNATTIKDQNGRIIGIQGIFRDISHRRRHNSINRYYSNASAKKTVPGHTYD